MTDKQKIRNYACKLLKDSQNGFGSASYNMLKMVIGYIDSLPEEPVSEDLEEAASVYQTFHRYATPFKAYIDGAKWKKEQMINSAKKSKIVITSGGILLSDLKIEDFDYADKVKVIIIKENKDE